MAIRYKYTNIPLDTVEYNEQQTLTDEQKGQARQNIGAQSIIDSSHKLSSDLIDDTNQTNKFVTSAEKVSWDSKSTVTFSATGTSTTEAKYATLNGAEYKLSFSTDGLEKTENKVTSISASSTHNQYPSAKCVYDLIGDIDSALAALL